MTPTNNALLLCALFLCALEETVLSQHGHCTANQCSALFQEPNDFLGAQKRCSESGGKLFETNFKDVDGISKSLPSGLNGMYWLHLEGIRMTPDLCLAILLATGQDVIAWLKPCSENLDGFLCQYTFNEPCSVLPVGADAQVSYTTLMGFQVNDSENFPPGTIAVAGKVGGKYLDSKHLCFSSTWLSAPWNCEVVRGGCEHSCNSSTQACVCASGQTLHPNKVSCVEDNLYTECAQDCPQDIVAHVPECSKGYRLAPDGKNCVDVNECEEESPCTGEGEECVNTQGHFDCTCSDGFELEDGACVNVTICQLCEHMRCDKFNGVYQCVCKKGFRVSPHNPTKCEILCTESSCPASCIKSQEEKKKDMMQCFCPEGYILDINDGTASCTDIDECVMANQCDHECENFFGGYRCLCNEGYKLDKGSRCLPITDDDDDGSGSTTQYPIPASPHPAMTPSYIKTGSILGIAVFVVLCVVLLAFLVNNIFKRCGKFEISTLKHHNIDIFYLHQVTSETYKKLSFDKQFKNDPQIL